MKTNKQEIINQIAFCEELMNRLYQDCLDNLNNCSLNEVLQYGISHGTTMKQDSIRLRRELNKFNKMITYNY